MSAGQADAPEEAIAGSLTPLERGQLRRHARTLGLLPLGGGTIAIGLAAILWSSVDGLLLAGWISAVALSLMLPMWAQARVDSALSAERAGPRHLRLSRFAVAMHGLVWTGLGLSSITLQTADAQAEIALGAGVMVIGVTIAWAFDPKAWLGFAAPAALVPLVHLLGHPTMGIGPALLLVSTLAVMIWVAAHRGWKAFLRSEQRRSERAAMLREAGASARRIADQDRLREQLLQNTSQGIWFLDNEGRTTDVNAAMCRLLGREREAIVGQQVRAFFSDEDLEILNHQLELRKRGHKEGYEIGITRPDGSRVACFNNATPIYDANGEKVGSVGMWTDLTPIVQAHRETEARKLELQTLLEAFPGYILAIDQDGRCEYVNRATAERLGGVAEAFVGQTMPSVLAQYPPYRKDTQWFGNLKPGERVITERTYPAAFGLPEVVVEVSRVGGPRRPDGGMTVYTFGIDITERKRAEAAIRAHEARIGAILQAFPGSIAGIADDGTVVYLNERMAHLIGRPAAELLGKSLTRLSFPGETVRFLLELVQAPPGEMLTRVITLSDPEEHAVRAVRVTGVSGLPHDEQTRISYAFGIAIDDLFEAQRAIERARDEAEQANLAKSQFLSQMSHELRTPLNAILGFAQLLGSDREHPLDSRQQRQAQEIVVGAQHLLRLISGLLDFARIEAGKLTIQLSTIGLSEVVSEALSLMRPLAERQGIALPLRADIDPHLAVSADRTRLLQVVLNLLSNAIKYNRPAGRVRVGAGHEEGWTVFWVQDEGQGLSAEQRNRLFEPFQRLVDPNSTIEGTGIGLALSRRLMEAMDGQIRAESEPGQGCRFTIWLRAADPQEDRLLPATQIADSPVSLSLSPAGEPWPSDPPDPNDATKAAPMSPPKSLGVLYIEDNPVNLMVMEAIIDRLPEIRLHCAPDGEEGLRIAASEALLLVLTDLQMPGIDGFEVLRRLRAQPATRHLPVVAVSADALPETIARTRSAGFDDYIAKPIEIPQLYALLSRQLGREFTPID